MAEIRVSSTLLYHPKVESFVKQAGITRTEAVGHLVFLWLWCADHAIDGVLPKMHDTEIATTCKFFREAKPFVDALVDSGFLERVPGSLKVHDWDQWIPDSLRSKLWRERKTTRKRMEKPVRNELAGESLSLSLPAVKRETTETTTKAVKSKPPHVEFVDRFKAFYEAIVKKPFKYGRAQFVISERLIRDHGNDMVIEKAKILAFMCKNQSTWFTKGGWGDFSIEKLSNQWNAILSTSVPKTAEQEMDDVREKWREHNERVSRIMASR